MARPFTPLHQRFWSKVNKGGPEDCWLWTGAVSGTGYGRVTSGGQCGTLLFAHRLSFEIHTGAPAPQGMHVCHRCDTPACVNPQHLFLGTPKENAVDMAKKGRAPSTELDAHKVRAIREMRAAGRSQRVIAARFGVCKATVQRVLIGKTWIHVA